MEIEARRTSIQSGRPGPPYGRIRSVIKALTPAGDDRRPTRNIFSYSCGKGKGYDAELCDAKRKRDLGRVFFRSPFRGITENAPEKMILIFFYFRHSISLLSRPAQ